MSLAHLLKHVLDSLWAVGGIGAAADLGLEDFSPAGSSAGPAARPNPGAGVRGSRRLPKAKTPGTPLEGELCSIPSPSCSFPRSPR